MCDTAWTPSAARAAHANFTPPSASSPLIVSTEASEPMMDVTETPPHEHTWHPPQTTQVLQVLQSPKTLLTQQSPRALVQTSPGSARRGAPASEDADSAPLISIYSEVADTDSSFSRPAPTGRSPVIGSIPPEPDIRLNRECMRDVPTTTSTSSHWVIFETYTIVGVLRDDPRCLTFKAWTPDCELCVIKMMTLPSSRLHGSRTGTSLLGSPKANDETMEILEKLEQINHPALGKVHKCHLLKRTDGADTVMLVRDYLRQDTLLHPRMSGNTLVHPVLSESGMSTLGGSLYAALAHLHERGLAHGRLKPSNVLTDGRGHAFVVDYGLLSPRAVLEAKPCDPAIFTAEELLFQSPQVLLGQPYDPAANDMWGVGVLLYTALKGHPPFATPEAVISATSVPSLPSHIVKKSRSNSLAGFLIQKLLVRSEKERWTACDVLRAFVKTGPWDDWEGMLPDFADYSPIKRGSLKSPTTSDSYAVAPTLHVGGRSQCSTETLGHSDGYRRQFRHSRTVSRGNSFDASLLADADAPGSVHRSVSSVAPYLSFPGLRGQGILLEEGITISSTAHDDSPLGVSSVQMTDTEMAGLSPSSPPSSGVRARVSSDSSSRAYLTEAVGEVHAATLGVRPSQSLVPHPPRTLSMPTGTEASPSWNVHAAENDIETPLRPALGLSDGAPSRPVSWVFLQQDQQPLQKQPSQQSRTHSPYRGSLLMVPRPGSGSNQALMRTVNMAENEPGHSLMAHAEAIVSRPVDAVNRSRSTRPAIPSHITPSAQPYSPAANLVISTPLTSSCSPMSLLPTASSDYTARTTDRCVGQSVISSLCARERKNRTAKNAEHHKQ